MIEGAALCEETAGREIESCGSSGVRLGRTAKSKSLAKWASFFGGLQLMA